MPQILLVLLVDDEPQQRAVVRFLLKKSGIEAECVEANGVTEGLAAFADRTFDCALVDYHLADGTALDFLQKLPETGPSTPVIVLTAEEDEAVDLAASQAGADDFLMKYNLAPDTLRRTIRRVIERHRRGPRSGGAMPEELKAAPETERYGRFIRHAKIGSGGLADVYRAWDTRDARWVALKIQRHSEPDDLLRLSREGITVASLAHPYIAKIYDIGIERGQSFIAMQLIRGPSLGELLLSRRRDGIRAIQHTALALDYAHGKGVIHRDVKPSNIMLTGSGGELHTYLMDFGLVKRHNSVETRSDTIIGTPPYMSPEHVQGWEVDGRTDVYSLGATLFAVLAFRPPFECETLAQATYAIVYTNPPALLDLDPTIEPRLVTIVEKCLQKEPAKRYAKAAEVASDLAKLLA